MASCPQVLYLLVHLTLAQTARRRCSSSKDAVPRWCRIHRLPPCQNTEDHLWLARLLQVWMVSQPRRPIPRSWLPQVLRLLNRRLKRS